jgi:hypothetical protein bacD2_10672
MKRITFALLTFLFAFASCEQDTEPVYSCNKDANAWVKKNLTKVQKMKRSEWQVMEEEYGRAAYNAFTPEQKLRFWEEKIGQTLKLPWNEKEIAHIHLLKDYIINHAYIFENRELSNEEKDEFELFFYEWTKNAQQELGWTKKTIGAIAASGYDVEDKQGNIKTTRSKNMSLATMSTATESKCHCNIEHSFCEIWECQKSNCEDSAHGCGWLLVQSCNGRCGDI